MRASGGGGSNNTVAVAAAGGSAAVQQQQQQEPTNQQNSPNDSGISLAEGDLLGVLVEGGMNKVAGGKEQE